MEEHVDYWLLELDEIFHSSLKRLAYCSLKCQQQMTGPMTDIPTTYRQGLGIGMVCSSFFARMSQFCFCPKRSACETREIDGHEYVVEIQEALQHLVILLVRLNRKRGRRNVDLGLFKNKDFSFVIKAFATSLVLQQRRQKEGLED